MESSSYLFAGNAVFIEELYSRYCDDPSSVSEEWQKYFNELSDNPDDIAKAIEGASWMPFGNRVIGVKEEKKRLKI